MRTPQAGVAVGTNPVSARVRSNLRAPGAAGNLTARDFLDTYGYVFDIADPDRQLVQTREEVDSLSFTHTTFEQVHNGVPVFSGVLKVHQNGDGDFLSANGRFYPIPEKLNTQPTLSEDEAVAIASLAVTSANPMVEDAKLVIVDPAWYGDAPRGERLAYYLTLSDDDLQVREAFFVDAHTGEILDQWSRICTARSRMIYNGQNDWSLPGTLVRKENDSPVASPADANRAYDYYGDTYDYYWRAFHRDSIDNHGMSLVATVQSTYTGCPNAAWIGYYGQMAFCQGTVTDDVVAHELTHGVTEFTANLIYQNQPGQLNESFSDVFGELVDLFNGGAAFPGTPVPTDWPTHPTGSGLDAPNNLRTTSSPKPAYPNGVRWVLGEDADAFGGAIRDMWDPMTYGDPDRLSSPLQTCSPWDNGGVHSGSGVPNHAFAIATDGKTFNGYTVAGVGPIKSGAVWHRALTVYLTPVSDFQDAYFALLRAASDLVGTFPRDPRTGLPSDVVFTQADVNEIDKALKAVEMDTIGPCGAHTLFDVGPVTACSPQSGIRSDDFDSGANGWTVTSSGPDSSPRWSLVTDLEDGREGFAWFAPDPGDSCYSGDHSAFHRLESPSILIPSGAGIPMLEFTHLMQSEFRWDGGNVKIKVNNGPWKLLPGGAFIHNPYKVEALTETASGSTNELAGEPGFTGMSGQWVKSVANLSGVAGAGDSIRLRFEFGRDYCGGVNGWYIDDVKVYSCDSSGDCNGNGIPDDVETAGGGHRDIIVDQPPLNSAFVVFDDYDAYSGALLFAPSFAEDFSVSTPKQIERIVIWGEYWSTATRDEFIINLRSADGDTPGAIVAANISTDVERSSAGTGAIDEVWELAFSLTSPLAVLPGRYFLEVYPKPGGSSTSFLWTAGEYLGRAGFAFAYEAPGLSWQWWDPDYPYDRNYFDLALRIEGEIVGADCNTNGVPDDCELQADCNNNGIQDICDAAAGTAEDCNGDGILNECDSDCNGNGEPDGCDIADGRDTDCNGNSIPDECDFASGVTVDCNDNGIYDVCENDCNRNGREDSCDVNGGGSSDCNQNDIPDECEPYTDCNNNDRQDICDIHSGASADCDGNKLPDECEIDSDEDGTIDACDECASDSTKTTPGQCGCGSADTDSDSDGAADCVDGCPNDKNKKTPGKCGCGVSDVDSDADSVPDCLDMCPNGDDTVDTDTDGVPDCADECPDNPELSKAGQCGCDEPELDPDLDGIADCIDNCPVNRNADQKDSDGDGMGDACDGCPFDAAKTSVGICGCGAADVDDDGDGTINCLDNCPDIPNENQADTDEDGVGDVCDGCPEDSDKVAPGDCGCGESETDADFDGVPDCVDDCLRTPQGLAVDSNGCPLETTIGSSAGQSISGRDGDGDGVPDDLDACPATAYGMSVDAAGCPLAVDSTAGRPTAEEDTTADEGSAPCGLFGTAAPAMLVLGMVGLRVVSLRRRRR